MKQLFGNLNYFFEKVNTAAVADETVTSGEYGLAEVAYATIKDLIDEAEREIIAHYGSLKQVGLDYEFELLWNLFDLLDNNLDEIPLDIKVKVKYYLCSDMCTRVRNIANRYETIDQEMKE